MAKDRKSRKGQEEGGEEEVKVQPGKEPLNDDSGTAKQSGKKGKKNRRKDDWEDDVANELEALSLETKGESKPQDVEADSLPEKKQKEKTRGKADPSHENASEENFKGRASKKQKGKKGRVEESDDENIGVVKGGKKGSIVSDDEEPNIKDTRKTRGKKLSLHDSDDEDSLTQRKGKGKKKGKGIDSDDESMDIAKNQKMKKKGQKAKNASDDETDIANDSKLGKRKGKKTQEILSDDEGSKDKEHSVKQRQKKDKGSKKSKNIGSDDEIEEEVLKSKANKGTKTSKPKSGFQLLEMDDMDVDDELSDESPVEVKTKQKKQSEKDKPKVEEEEVVDATICESKKDVKGAKKSKKKDRKKKDDDDEEEDVDKILEELAMEMEGKKPPEKPKEEPKVAAKDETVISEDVKPSEMDEQGKKKKKKKKSDADVSTSEKPTDDKEPSPDAAGEEPTIKTAAQKKKEKKERERLKKLAQNEQEHAKSSKHDPSKEQKTAVVEARPPQEEESQALEEDKADEDEADDKKKKKKKKKGDEEEKKDKKRPGKKAIAAMQEALKKVKEEEERAIREEEEKQKAAEEAERLRQEKLRLEQEKKEKKKQKEKEKRERLKAEGKLLTKTQRQARARMEATLAALRQQGVEVPQIGEKIGEKKPRLGARIRTPRKKEEEKHDATPEVKVEIIVEPQKPEENEPQDDNKELVSEELETEAVKDAWDETSEDEMEEDEAEQEESPLKSGAAVEAPLKKQESVEESDECTESEESCEEEESETEEESSDDSDDDGKTQEEKIRERAMERIRKRREDAEKNRSLNKLRSPVVCVLGHVDTGKTSLLDKIRRTHVQGSEAGGITQQIGATMVPQEALKEKCKMVKNFADLELKIPGLLIIDTPGHESFSNLRSRGSSLCDIAVLVVDVMHGLEQQTIESINLLKMKKTPFIVALNKVDRVYEWKCGKIKDVQDVIKTQARNTKMEFEKRTKEIIVQFAEQSLNAALYYENPDPRSWISMVPTSAHSGDGMGNLLALVVELTQTMMAKRIAFTEELQATVLEVKAIPGLGTTIDVILVNGRLREGDSIVLAGHDGAMVTQIRALLMPQPLKELRVKTPYEEFKEVEGAQGVKIAGKDLDKAIAGLQLLVAHHPDEVDILKEEVNRSLQDAMNAIKLAERGVYVQASTLGSLEALLEFLKVSKVPYSGVRIGPVVKKDVMKASIMLEHDSQYAVILAFDVKIERDAQELADSLGVKIFQADIIYHLFQRFTDYRLELMNKKREEFKNIAVFPCKLRILPQFVFNSRDPIVVGVVIEAGVVKDGTPLCVPSKEFLDIGTVSTIEINHKTINSARKGQEVCIKIEPNGGEAPKMFGRHFDHTDLLVSKISRQSIDACKEYFRDDLQKADWQLMVELKKTFQIL